MGLVRIEEFQTDIFLVCCPAKGECFERRDNVFQAVSVYPHTLSIEKEKGFNITLNLQVLEDDVRILSINVPAKNVVFRGYGHPDIQTLKRGDVISVILVFTADNVGSEKYIELR